MDWILGASFAHQNLTLCSKQSFQGDFSGLRFETLRCVYIAMLILIRAAALSARSRESGEFQIKKIKTKMKKKYKQKNVRQDTCARVV